LTVEGSFSKSESLALAVFSYLAFASASVGVIVSLIRAEAVSSALFAITLVSMFVVKRTYSRKLCWRCNVLSCPFNPKRRRKAA